MSLLPESANVWSSFNAAENLHAEDDPGSLDNLSLPASVRAEADLRESAIYMASNDLEVKIAGAIADGFVSGVQAAGDLSKDTLVLFRRYFSIMTVRRLSEISEPLAVALS